MLHNRKALILFSGGQDSTACLLLARELCQEVHTISFEYGQQHDLPGAILRQRALHWGALSHYAVSLSDYPEWARSKLLARAVNSTSHAVPERNYQASDKIPDTFVPGRNLLFLNIAAIYAYQRQIDTLILGVSEVDYSGYPDCRAEFIASSERTLGLAFGQRLGIYTPLIYMKKSGIWAIIDQLTDLYEADRLTKTCYSTRPSQSEHRACGHCAACQLRIEGLRAFRDDPRSCALEAQVALEKATAAFKAREFER